MNDQGTVLNDEGQERREAILAIAIDEARRVQQQRRRNRGLLTTAGISLGLLLVMQVVLRWPVNWLEPPVAFNAEVDDGAEVAAAASSEESLAEYLVEIKPVDLDRYLVGTRREPADYVLLDDEQLLKLLASLGQPDGIVKMNGKTRLASQLLDIELAPSDGNR